MNIDSDLLSGSLNPLNALKIIKYRIDFAKEHPNYYVPEGLLTFCGSQGSRKNLVSCAILFKMYRKI